MSGETSPYLLQHRDNPVHWQPWSVETLDRAKAENKPILLSVGYAACHWCHVMAHESFENDQTAQVMNDLFVNIKVDREERPDIDSIYQSALALLGEHGGWPLTMFLTPAGEPFWGGTYFPPEPRYGRPGFRDVLIRVEQIYRTDPDVIAKNSGTLKDALTKMSRRTDGDVPVLDSGFLDRVAARLANSVDVVHGGIGGAPKFPQTTALETIWRGYLRTGNQMLGDLVHLSLKNMCQGGIYDHLAGGFARYATDERWLVPHFEKMLYDNALLIDLMTTAWQRDKDDLYAVRIAETIDWIARDMVTPDGGIAASYDADSEGEEGRFYVWSEAEIDRLAGNTADLFKQVYDVTPEGNWESRTILNRSRDLSLADPETEAELGDVRAILLKTRNDRVWPGWDDKVLVDWNGLAIAAIARAGAVFGRADWADLARRAYAFVTQSLNDNGRLFHSYRDGRARHSGLLDDYANMSWAALELFEISGQPHLIDDCRRWKDILDRHFWDTDQGGYYYTADDAEALITRTRHAHDNAIPAGNGTMVSVLQRLFHVTGEMQYQRRADELIAAFAPDLARNVFPFTTLLNGLDTRIHDRSIVIVGDRQGEDTGELLRTVHAHCLPGRALLIVPPAGGVPTGHPAAGKSQIDGRATAYVCHGGTCSLPLTDPSRLAEALQTL